MSKLRYPSSLFVLGIATNFLFHFFWLSVPSGVLLIVGIFLKPCLFIGLALLTIDIILSLVEQLQIRRVFLTQSENPDFREFQDALSRDGSWMKNIRDLTEHQIKENFVEEKIDQEEAHEEKVK